jgi:hypothetical protein
MLIYVLQWLPSWISDRHKKQNICRGPSNDDPMGKMFQNASLKPLGQLKPNCPGMIIGRSSTNVLFFMPIGNPRWQPLHHPMNIHVQFGFNHICSF